MNFNESVFRARVDKALERVKKILDNTRHPTLFDNLLHSQCLLRF